jgi:Leucine-rich repeat (LRR) protein
MDSLPDFLGELEELEYINVSNNRIREIHPGISRLKKLKEIDLSSNKGLFGLNSFMGNKSLERLDLSNCALLVFPYYITMIPSLKKLLLIGNDFERLPLEIRSLKKLEILYLNESLAFNLEDTIEVLTELESLQECFIPVIDVMKLPQNILKLKHLKKITFYPIYFNKGKFPDQEFVADVLENLKKDFPNTEIELID